VDDDPRRLTRGLLTALLIEAALILLGLCAVIVAMRAGIL